MFESEQIKRTWTNITEACDRLAVSTSIYTIQYHLTVKLFYCEC